MKPPGQAIGSLAQRLLEHEAGTQPDAEGIAAGAEDVCGKLSGHLEPLVGPMGFHVLLGRALHLASAEFPVLEGVRSGEASDGWLLGLGERVLGRDPREVRAAVTAVLARFLEVMAHFIGEDLTVRIVSRTWPDVRLETVESAFGGEAV